MATVHIYREASRRSHKLLAMYLSIWAWNKGVDCVVLPRETLLPFLGLKQMRNQRINWLTTDAKSLLPHKWTTISSRTNVYATLYLSRKRIPAAAGKGSMTDEERVDALAEARVAAALVTLPVETRMVTVLSRMIHGLSDFSTAKA